MFKLKQSVIDKIDEVIRPKYYADNFLSLQQLTSDLNIRIINAKFRDDNISGGLKKEGENFTIYVNQSDSNNRRRFTVAHEIGHYISYLADSLSKQVIDEQSELLDYAIIKRDGKMQSQDVEKEANEIAGRILMPKTEIEYLINHKNFNIDELADYFYVSTAAVLVRLRNLGYNVLEW